MSIAIKRLERAISDLPKGGMQTGSHKVKLDLADAERLIVELNALQAERDALAVIVVYMFNRGYKLGHHDSVEGMYLDIKECDMNSFHSDVCSSILTDESLQHHLAVHDAEVAKAAFKAGWLCRADRRSFKFEEEAENYADQLRAKADQ